jgi:hypothetical protein
MQVTHSPPAYAPGNAALYRLEPESQGRAGPTRVDTDSAPLVFVTGASRSGTTMLARMLGSHSAVMTFNELHFFGSLWDPFDTGRAHPARELAELAATLLARQTHGLWGGSPTEVEQAWGRRLVRSLPERDCHPAGLFAAVLVRLAQDSGRRIGCEQTPRNIFYARRLLELYPQARIVHIVRDPRAVLASQKGRWRLRRLGASHLPVSEMLRNRVNYHPLTMSNLWVKANEEALRLMGHPRLLVVRFEDLAEDPEPEVRRLARFLDLDYEPGMLDVPRWGSSNLTHDSSAKGVAREAVDRWRDSISQGECLLCERICHLTMQRLGYVPELLGRRGLLTCVPSLLSYPLHAAGVMALNPGRAWVQIRALARAGAGP